MRKVVLLTGFEIMYLLSEKFQKATKHIRHVVYVESMETWSTSVLRVDQEPNHLCQLALGCQPVKTILLPIKLRLISNDVNCFA